MPSRAERQNKTRSRVSNACQRCRKQKIKCSGSEPCETCVTRGYRCVFSADDRKIVISESALHDLRRKVNELEKLQRQSSNSQQPAVVCSPDNPSIQPNDDDNVVEVFQQDNTQPSQELSVIDNDAQDESISQVESAGDTPTAFSNPLVPEQPAYLLDKTQRMRFLGHSSTWSFSQQVLHMMHESPHITPSSEPSLNTEGTVYKVNATKSSLQPQEITGLPSLDLSLFYMQCVKFRTNPMYYLFDEDEFLSNLHRFYDSKKTCIQDQKFWYIHYLLIMAFGKALNAPNTSCLAGTDFLNKALGLLPDITVLCQDPVHSSEILCCIALYLQSIDHRTAAHIYVGQALRMAQTFGLYTDMQPNTVGENIVTRCRRIWWTVYALERRLGTSFGVPCGFQDADISMRYPSAVEASTSAMGQTIHVKICQLLGRVVSTVYRYEDTLNKTVLTTAQDVLRGMAGLATEIAQFSDRCIGEISRVSASLMLAYHQCIILASRPFLFYLLKTRLGSPDPSKNLRLPSSLKGLIQVCIDSAVQAAMVLSQLKQHELLDNFLPFDLETAFSAALVLVIASGVHPKLLPRENWLDICYATFDYMSAGGNLLASLRKSEVEQLAQIQHGFGRSRPRQDDFTGMETTSNIAAAHISPTGTSIADYSSLPSLGDPFFDAWIADDGFSGTQLLDLADSLDAQDMIF